jgi:hypothetical protein
MIASLSTSHKISKYIDYPNVKELFFIFAGGKEVPLRGMETGCELKLGGRWILRVVSTTSRRP